ncbi:MAG: AAA family ATPase [Chitinophagales bacterium]
MRLPRLVYITNIPAPHSVALVEALSKHFEMEMWYYKEIVKFIRVFLGGVLKSNAVLYKGVITGILQVSKESIFSDLNNIEVYSVLDDKYADKFGFTEPETKDLLNHFQLIEDFDLVKQWYDGYRMGSIEDIYNPWSITGYILKHQQGFKAHWVNTSSDELIRERIAEKGAKEIRSSIEKLLLGESIEKTIEERMIFDDFYGDKELLWSLLLFAGYLTPIKKLRQDFYQLRIPNQEIKIVFKRTIRHWLERGMNITHSLLHEMIESLTHNRIKEFEKHFQAIMGDTFSYFDVTKNPEDVWQAYVLGLLAIAEEDYIIRSNRESGDGRYDILLLPKVKNQYGIVIEIKAMDKEATQAQIDAKLDEALGQIEKNEYYKELIAHNIHKRIEIAMVFAGKKIYLKPK